MPISEAQLYRQLRYLEEVYTLKYNEAQLDLWQRACCHVFETEAQFDRCAKMWARDHMHRAPGVSDLLEVRRVLFPPTGPALSEDRRIRNEERECFLQVCQIIGAMVGTTGREARLVRAEQDLKRLADEYPAFKPQLQRCIRSLPPRRRSPDGETTATNKQ